jgi:hypothetical protein
MLLLLFAGNLDLLSQSVFVASGGDFKSNGGSISFSFGQVMADTYNSSVGQMYIGVQLPFEISQITSTYQAYKYDVLIYPNLVDDKFNISYSSSDDAKLKYLIYSSQGSIVHAEKKLLDEKEEVDVSDYASGEYFILFYSPKGYMIKTIIKI